MKKYYLVGICSLLLSGCVIRDGKFASQNYIVDLKQQRYCIEDGFECYAFSLIQPSFREGWIAAAFSMPKQYYSWRGEELAALVLNPPDDRYQAEQVGDQLYRVPPTYATHVVWDVLAMEYYTLYRDDEDMLLQQRWPQPRRFATPN